MTKVCSHFFSFLFFPFNLKEISLADNLEEILCLADTPSAEVVSAGKDPVRYNTESFDMSGCRDVEYVQSILNNRLKE